jgi:zeaxanthin glucosyltransferase
MAHFAIVCPEDAGHLLPNVTVGTELLRRGHRVTLVAREKCTPLAAQLDLPLYNLEIEDVPWPSAYLIWRAFSTFGAGYIIGMRVGFERHAEAILRKVPRVLKELAVDGVLVDQNMAAGGTAAERVGVPFVTVSSALLWNEEVGVPPPFTSWKYGEGRLARIRNRLGYAGWHWFMRPTLKVINRYRRAWQLRPLSRMDVTFSSLAQISPLCPGFDFPRRDLPKSFYYVGSLASGRRCTIDPRFPWERLDGRPLIFASLGTIPDPSNVPVFQKIASACAGLDAQLVLTLGQWGDELGIPVREKIGVLPGDPIVVDFAPQLALLDKAALLITHAGSNTVIESLCRGVPMVALPRSADQPGMGSRIEYSGTGLCASFRDSTPQEIRKLIERVLTEEIFRRQARKLQQVLIAAGGPQRAADIAEKALATRHPVRRR